MKKFEVSIGGRKFIVNADRFHLVEDFVSFYKNNACVGIARLSPSDSVIELTAVTT